MVGPVVDACGSRGEAGRLRACLMAIAVGVALVVPSVALGYPQANDSFSAAEVIEGTPGSTFGESFKATKEAGEPVHAGNPGGASLWYRWVAPENGEFAFATEGFDFDTLLAVYTGTGVAALTEIASNDDWIRFDSRVAFDAIAGTEYRVAVDGYAGSTGGFSLSWMRTPVGDEFADAVAIDGRSGTATGSNLGATEEPGEPLHAGCGSASIWYEWTAPATERVRFDTRGSRFDTTLAVYTGAAVDALTVIAANDDFASLESDVSFQATAGSSYSIAVAGCGRDQGNVTLHWYPGAIIFGTKNADSLAGTPGRDYIDARRGNDVVRGLGGADFIVGGAGDDRLFGGRSNDILDSRDRRRGNDLVSGGAGQDTAHTDQGDRVRGVP
jgi:Ca2+-binding RTX toxin-like protein